MIVASTQDKMQRAVQAMVRALEGKINVRSQIVINTHTVEQVNGFSCLEYTITRTKNIDLEIKTIIFKKCSTRKTLIKKRRII